VVVEVVVVVVVGPAVVVVVWQSVQATSQATWPFFAGCGQVQAAVQVLLSEVHVDGPVFHCHLHSPGHGPAVVVVEVVVVV